MPIRVNPRALEVAVAANRALNPDNRPWDRLSAEERKAYLQAGAEFLRAYDDAKQVDLKKRRA
jgi:acyl-CoA reductase-like NAD-dependent aldehyde dehydrogenase